MNDQSVKITDPEGLVPSELTLEFAKFAKDNWQAIFWGMYGRTEIEQFMGSVLSQINTEQNSIATLSRYDATSNEAFALIRRGYIAVSEIDSSNEKKRHVRVTLAGCLHILAHAAQKHSITPENAGLEPALKELVPKVTAAQKANKIS